MDKQTAITIIKNVSAGYRGTLQEHNQIQTAISFVEAELNKGVKSGAESKRKGISKNT